MRSTQASILFFLANGMLFASSAASIPRIAERLDLTAPQVAAMTAALSLGSICIMSRTGALIRRYGSRNVCCAAAAFATLLLPLVVEAESYGVLLAFGVCFGAAMGTMDVAMNAFAIAAQRQRNISLLSQMHGCWSIGSVIASAAMAALVMRAVPVPVTQWARPRR